MWQFLSRASERHPGGVLAPEKKLSIFGNGRWCTRCCSVCFVCSVHVFSLHKFSAVYNQCRYIRVYRRNKETQRQINQPPKHPQKNAFSCLLLKIISSGRNSYVRNDKMTHEMCACAGVILIYSLGNMAKRKWGKWSEYFSTKKNKYYYFNEETKETTYTMPAGFNENATPNNSDAPPAKRAKKPTQKTPEKHASGSAWQKGYSKSKVYKSAILSLPFHCSNFLPPCQFGFLRWWLMMKPAETWSIAFDCKFHSNYWYWPVL